MQRISHRLTCGLVARNQKLKQKKRLLHYNSFITFTISTCLIVSVIKSLLIEASVGLRKLKYATEEGRRIIGAELEWAWRDIRVISLLQ